MADDVCEPAAVDPWHVLRRHTSARIALGRSGTSLPTAPHLAFQLAHARARKAVHHVLDTQALQLGLFARGFDVLALHSEALDRACYLQRPPLGRRLDAASRAAVAARMAEEAGGFDLALVIGDGLSALAIEENALPFLDALRVHLDGWRIAPVSIVEQARVAIGDDIGESLQARMVVVLIGERPGLSSPDSLGIYFTYMPKSGLTDEARNCISNVRKAGLSHQRAATKLFYLMEEAMRRGYSGVHLKDEEEVLVPVTAGSNFLIPEH